MSLEFFRKLISALSFTLFWPSALRFRIEQHSPSVLTQLPARSVAALPRIAARPPRYGRTLDDKKAIIRLVDNQKLKTFAVFLAVIFTAFMYNGFGLISLFLVPSALLLGSVLDFLRWNPEYERKLINELNERHVELGIPNFPAPCDQKEFVVRDEGQNISALRERTENGMSKKEKFLAKLKVDCARGSKHYSTLLSGETDFEIRNHGRWININIETGEYALGEDEVDVRQKFDALCANDTSCWQKRIGYIRNGPNFNWRVQPAS